MSVMLSRRGMVEGLSLAPLLLGGCRRKPKPAFSEDGLAHLREGLERAVAEGYAPGVVGLVADGPEARDITVGRMAFDGPAMQRDSIFRIASMSKAITAAAVMMLVEDGRLRLEEPVDRLLPELANRRVLRTLESDLDDTVPATRPITVEDLLTFRCGYGLILAPPERYPILQAVAKLGIVGFGPPDPAMPFDNDQWIAKLGGLPLMAQPGETWLYTTGSDIQGVLVARVTGQLLSRFCEERIFGPLGMSDTAFFVPAGKTDRLTTVYQPVDGRLFLADPPVGGKWNQPPMFEQGDSGLVSTADDYLTFARMLLAGGRHNGKAILAEAAVAAMTRNHLTPAQQAAGEQILGRGRGWGYGLSVVTEAQPNQPGNGAFGWNGGYGSSWFSDPGNGLTAILLTQRECAGPVLDPVHSGFQSGAYGALA